MIDSFHIYYKHWTIKYSNGTEVETDVPPISNCEIIGETFASISLDEISDREFSYEFPNTNYEEAWWHFKDGLCPIRINHKWGFVDSNFRLVIQPRYDLVGDVRSKERACRYRLEFIHSVEWKDGICKVYYNGKESWINEKGEFVSTYAMAIRQVENLTIKDIIRISREHLPGLYVNHPWTYPGLEHGTAVLQTEEQCCAYMAAYGPMHRHKLLRALDENEFPYRALSNGVEIYDWGCGQGIGTIAIIEKLRENNQLSKLKKITLEEPSDVARQRAKLHVKQAVSDLNVDIIDTSLYLPSDNGVNSNSITEINVQEPCAIHIFSNILDIEAVSLKGVSKMITSSGNQHIALCIGPANLNESRINTFSYYFKKEGLRVFTEFRDTNFGRHPNGRAYGCLIKSFTYSLAHNCNILHKYKYFAPVQLFASYSDTDLQGSLLQSAFEVLAPFDMTAHKNLCPVYALVSNLISRGRPTIASQKVLDAISSKERAKNLNAAARIQKTLAEAIISDRLDLKKDTWEILVIEDGTSIAKLALNDFAELYHHIVAMTQDYSDITLPAINIHSKKEAKTEVTYDAIIDVSIDQICNPEQTTTATSLFVRQRPFMRRGSSIQLKESSTNLLLSGIHRVITTISRRFVST